MEADAYGTDINKEIEQGWAVSIEGSYGGGGDQQGGGGDQGGGGKQPPGGKKPYRTVNPGPRIPLRSHATWTPFAVDNCDIMNPPPPESQASKSSEPEKSEGEKKEDEKGGEKEREKPTPLQIVAKATETTDQVLGATDKAVVGAQKIANNLAGTSSKILSGGEALEGVSHSLIVAHAVIVFADGYNNGFKPHHAADISADGLILAISLANPLAGLLVGGAYFVGNLVSEHYNGKTVTENLFDK